MRSELSVFLNLQHNLGRRRRGGKVRFASNTCVKTLRLRYLKKKKDGRLRRLEGRTYKAKTTCKIKRAGSILVFRERRAKKKHFFRVWEDLIRAAREKLLGGVRAWIPRASEKKIFRDEAEIL